MAAEHQGFLSYRTKAEKNALIVRGAIESTLYQIVTFRDYRKLNRTPKKNHQMTTMDMIDGSAFVVALITDFSRSDPDNPPYQLEELRHVKWRLNADAHTRNRFMVITLVARSSWDDVLKGMNVEDASEFELDLEYFRNFENHIFLKDNPDWRRDLMGFLDDHFLSGAELVFEYEDDLKPEAGADDAANTDASTLAKPPRGGDGEPNQVPWQDDYLLRAIAKWRDGRIFTDDPRRNANSDRGESPFDFNSHRFVELRGRLRTRAGADTEEITGIGDADGRRNERERPLLDWFMLDDGELNVLYIEGTAGAGKTTAMTRAALLHTYLTNPTLPHGMTRSEVADVEGRARAVNAAPRFPIVLACPILAKRFGEIIDEHSEHEEPSHDDLIEAIANTLAIFTRRGVSGADLRGQLEEPTLLLLDAIDEITDSRLTKTLKDAINELLSHYTNVRCIISSREQSRTGRAAVVRIQPPSVSERRAFVNKFVLDMNTSRQGALNTRNIVDRVERWYATLKQDNDAQTELLDTPLILNAVCHAAVRKKDLPRQYGALMEALLEYLLTPTAGEDAERVQQTRDVLCQLAYSCLESKRDMLEEDARGAAHELVGDREGGDRVFESALELCAFRINAQEDQPKIEFRPQLFRDYLAALHMVRIHGSHALESLAEDGRLGSDTWLEVAQFVPGILARSGESEAVLKQLDHLTDLARDGTDARLAVKLLEIAWRAASDSVSFKPGVREKFFDRLGGVYRDRRGQFDVHSRDRLVSLFGRLRSDLDRVLSGSRDWIAVPTGPISATHLDELKALHGRVVLEFELWTTPVLVFEYEEFVRATDVSDERFWTHAPEKHRGRTLGAIEELRDLWVEQLKTPTRPVVNVDWYEAAAYCAWRTHRDGDGWQVRLPTRMQWIRAAQHFGGGRYPWGDSPPERGPKSQISWAFSKLGRAASIGVFEPIEAERPVFDFGSNVREWGMWPDGEGQPWPPSGRGDVELFGGSWANRLPDFEIGRQSVEPERHARAPRWGFRVCRVHA